MGKFQVRKEREEPKEMRLGREEAKPIFGMLIT